MTLSQSTIATSLESLVCTRKSKERTILALRVLGMVMQKCMRHIRR